MTPLTLHTDLNNLITNLPLFNLYLNALISNTACGNNLKKTRPCSAVSGQIRSKALELDRLVEAAGVVVPTRLVVALLSLVVAHHSQPEQTMLLVVEVDGVTNCGLES